MATDFFSRLEGKVDRFADELQELTKAVMRLVVVEERQQQQGVRIGSLEQAISAVNGKLETAISACQARDATIDAKVERWVNRGLGVWAVVLAAFAFFNSSLYSGYVAKLIRPQQPPQNDGATQIAPPPHTPSPPPAVNSQTHKAAGE